MTEVRRVDVGDGHLHVEIHGPRHGDADTVVLLHGFAASTFSWRHVVPHLAARYRTIAIDRLGFGRSDRVARGDYSFAASVRHTIAVLDACGANRARRGAHSAGTAIAAALALQAPSRVDALVLIAPAIVGAGPPPVVRRALALPGVARVAPAALRAGAPLFARALARTWANPARVTPDVVDGYLSPLRARGTAEALVEMTLGDPTDATLVDRLCAIESRSLVITGARDGVVRAGDAQRVADALGCELVVIGDAGHLPHEEQPTATLAAIDAFL